MYVTLDSYGEQAFEAKVTRIVPFMDERSRTFKVEAKFVERPPTLFPNLTAEASIVLQVKENALRIPASYVVDDAFVLTGADTRTAVKLGLRDMQFVEVVSGIDLQTRASKALTRSMRLLIDIAVTLLRAKTAAEHHCGRGCHVQHCHVRHAPRFHERLEPIARWAHPEPHPACALVQRVECVGSTTDRTGILPERQLADGGPYNISSAA